MCKNGINKFAFTYYIKYSIRTGIFLETDKKSSNSYLAEWLN